MWQNFISITHLFQKEIFYFHENREFECDRTIIISSTTVERLGFRCIIVRAQNFMEYSLVSDVIS